MISALFIYSAVLFLVLYIAILFVLSSLKFNRRKTKIYCGDHAMERLKVGQMAILDSKNCCVCKKNV